jgi:hypothetical protein
MNEKLVVKNFGLIKNAALHLKIEFTKIKASYYSFTPLTNNQTTVESSAVE